MDNFDLRKYLADNKLTKNSQLFESPAQPAPARPERVPQPDVAPGVPKTKPQPRRRSTPSPSTSPTPAPKAMVENSAILQKIINRYQKALSKIDEADYTKIFDPETLGKLKGSVAKRMQGKNPMQIASTMQQLAMQVMQLEKGNEDLLEQLAYDIVYEAFPYLESNKDIIEIDAKIVPQAQVRDALKPNTPQEEDIDNLSAEEEAEMMEDAKKRRIINTITQGASTFSKSAHYIQQEYIDIIGGEGTSDKYRNLMQAALDMIDYMVGSGMSKQMSSAGMESSASGAESVFYDFEKEKWVIKARAIVFPVLILETVKGMYEIIGLFGFNNLEKGEKVVARVDKIENEPEDIAYGQLIAKNLQDFINNLDTNVTAEERDDFLQDIYKLPSVEFLKLITGIIKGTVPLAQKKQLQALFTQMRQDKTADAADDALLERLETLILKVDRRLQNLLLEVSIEDLKTQFVDTGKVSEEDFKEVVNAVGNKSAYATWIIKKVADGLIKGEDIYKYKDYFMVFDRQKRKYPKQDINQYKTQQDLETFIKMSIDLKKTEEEDPSQQKGVSKEDKYKQFYIGSVEGFNVYKIPQNRPDLYGTSCELGSGTQWCTATGKTNTHYKDHNKKGPLYIFIKPGSDEKYQFHYETNQFMDKNDTRVV